MALREEMQTTFRLEDCGFKRTKADDIRLEDCGVTHEHWLSAHTPQINYKNDLSAVEIVLIVLLPLSRSWPLAFVHRRGDGLCPTNLDHLKI